MKFKANDIVKCSKEFYEMKKARVVGEYEISMKSENLLPLPQGAICLAPLVGCNVGDIFFIEEDYCELIVEI